MNVLLISDDGVDSIGLSILRDSARAHYGPSAKIITITVKEPKSGASFSITPNMAGGNDPYVKYEEVEPYMYVVDGTPMDALYLGMLYPTYVLGTDRFNVVLSGVNQGHNVGVDIFHSGTVAVAMMAATVFGLASVAFSQEVPDQDDTVDDLANREYYRTAETFTRRVLQNHPFHPGSCLNVNFPLATPKGYKQVAPASYSRWLPSVTDPRAKQNDILAVKEGFITVSNLELSVATSLGM